MQQQASQQRLTSWQKFRNFLSDLNTIFNGPPDPEADLRRLVLFAGLLSCLASIGALVGFKTAYNRLLKDRNASPTLDGKPRAVYAMMIFFGTLGVLLPGFLILFIKASGGLLYSDFVPLIMWMIFNLAVSYFFMRSFRRWQAGIQNYLNELSRHGTARFATGEELVPYSSDHNANGLYIGAGFYYKAAGHLLTTAGTRAGKGVNLLIANLLKLGRFLGSWVVVDPKGETAAITAEYQRSIGKKVVMLNPWDLLGLGNTAYNPLDLLKLDRLNLSDDVQMIAECIVPTSAGGDADHFNNRARAVISGLLLHMVTRSPEHKKHLGTLWEWLRLSPEEWDKLLETMANNKDPHAGEIVQAAAHEILSLMEKGSREFASIISTAQKWTDFLKSPALRQSLANTKEFTSSDLSDGNTVVYIIIPSDRLKTHYQWLRLVVTSLMRSVIRNPKNDVCFLLDEFYALGYLSEIEIALGSYAGYGVHIWAVLQNLVQLQDQYGRNWENFISSCTVRHFFNVNDNTTADYVSKMFGTYSVPTYGTQGEVNGASSRNLVNPDELRRQSGETIYTVIDSLPPAKFFKWPYFNMGLVEGKDYKRNPYYKGK